MDQNRSLSRRRFITAAGLAAVGLTIAPRRMRSATPSIVESARQKALTTNVTTQALRGNVNLLTGSGGNIAVLSGTDGKLLVDSGYIGSKTKISEALDAISRDPIKHLVNTHWHFDHTDGNEWMHSAGATIFAHDNTKKHLSETTRVEDWDVSFPPSPAGAIPGDTFSAEKTLQLSKATIVIKYYGPAHTDGDLSVYFTEADVLHTGDTWWNGRFPFIDYSTGGNINGMIRAAEANITMATDKTIVIPGHGAIGGKTDLVQYRNLLVAIRDRIIELKVDGKSLEQILAAKPTAAYDEKWAGTFVNGDFFTRLVYKGL